MQVAAPRNIRPLVTLFAGLVASLLLLASAQGAVAAPIKLGVYVSAQGQEGAPESAQTLDEYAAMVGRKPDIVMDYSNITDPLLTSKEISNLSSRQETPLVTWQLYRSGWSGPTISLAEIAAGKYDANLREAAAAAKQMPFSEILIRFAHEMNGDWYGWSGDPTDYVAAWRHIVSLFRAEGATNVKWVWSPNVEYANGKYAFSSYYPGDEWVDYVGLDGYNWGTTGQGTGKWQSFYEVFKASYARLTQLSSKPVIITETSSSESGGSKASWIRAGLLETVPRDFPRVAAVVWFDRDQEEDWRINSSTASLAAYREVVANELYGGTEPAPIVDETEAPNAEVEAAEVAVEQIEVTPPTGSQSTGASSPESGSGSATTTTTTEIPGSAPRPTGKKKDKGKARSRVVRVRGRVVFKVSSAVRAVRFHLRGPGLDAAARHRAVTIRHPGRRGHLSLDRLSRGLLPNRRYRVVATAIGKLGSSKPRGAKFRVTASDRGTGRAGLAAATRAR